LLLATIIVEKPRLSQLPTPAEVLHATSTATKLIARLVSFAWWFAPASNYQLCAERGQQRVTWCKKNAGGEWHFYGHQILIEKERDNNGNGWWWWLLLRGA
jgi:hypothetical protein